MSEKLGTNLAEVGTDTISRQAAIDALAEQMPKPYTPDGSHPADEGIFAAQEIYADCVQTLEALPSVQPDNRLSKIADLVEGTIDHFDLDDAIDLLYQIKEVLK